MKGLHEKNMQRSRDTWQSRAEKAESRVTEREGQLREERATSAGMQTLLDASGRRRAAAEARVEQLEAIKLVIVTRHPTTGEMMLTHGGLDTLEKLQTQVVELELLVGEGEADRTKLRKYNAEYRDRLKALEGQYASAVSGRAEFRSAFGVQRARVAKLEAELVVKADQADAVARTNCDLLLRAEKAEAPAKAMLDVTIDGERRQMSMVDYVSMPLSSLAKSTIHAPED